jgi:hypothetical protein
MNYIHNGYRLFKRDVTLRGGKTITIFFFSKKLPKSGTPCELPTDKVVGVNKKSGLPYLQNKK